MDKPAVTNCNNGTEIQNLIQRLDQNLHISLQADSTAPIEEKSEFASRKEQLIQQYEIITDELHLMMKQQQSLSKEKSPTIDEVMQKYHQSQVVLDQIVELICPMALSNP